MYLLKEEGFSSVKTLQCRYFKSGLFHTNYYSKLSFSGGGLLTESEYKIGKYTTLVEKYDSKCNAIVEQALVCVLLRGTSVHSHKLF